MAEKRKTKRKKDEEFECFPTRRPEKPSKDEVSIAKWLKKNVPVKKTKFAGHNVEYFTGSKAVDALMESKWGKKEGEKEPFFLCRADAVYFLDTMLRHKFFHRAKKVPVSEQELKAKLKKKEKKIVEDDKKKKDEETADSSHAEGREVEDKLKPVSEERLKKCRKIKLEMHYEQFFVDNLDAYVWIFDPIPFYYWVIGALVVLGTVGICLFPLWPPTVRMGVQYISMAAAGFLLFILALAIVRLVIFCLIWAVTCGRLFFWLLPNLTEDVGFFASFWPLYQYKFMDRLSTSSKVKKSKKEKAKVSDDENENGKKIKPDEADKLLESVKDNITKESSNKKNADSDPTSSKDENKHNIEINNLDNDIDVDNYKLDEEETKLQSIVTDSETDSTESSSQQSQTGKDFEIIEKDETNNK